MKGLTEESIAQIDDPEKLSYLLSGVVQKNSKLLKKVRILQKQLKNAKSELANASTSLSEYKIKYESSFIYKFDYEFEKIRADYIEFAYSSLFRLLQNLDIDGNNQINLNSVFEEHQKMQDEFKTSQTRLFADLKSTISERDLSIQEKEKLIGELKDQIEQAELLPLPKEAEELLSEKDQSITKLRSLIQKYVKSDQIKQKQIDELQQQVQNLTESQFYQTQSRKDLNQQGKDNISHLENEIARLRSQLASCSSVNIQELEMKNKKLTAMLEKSNKYYTQLNEKYLSLKETLSQQKHNDLVIQQNLHFEILSTKSTGTKKKKSAASMDPIIITSLRKTLLQFFLTDEDNQINLIPVILEIVGCNQEQINGALVNYQRHQHLINRAGSFFGLFA